MKLIIVRHGETIANSKSLVQGKDDGQLNQKGIEQAKEVGRHLKEHHKIDMVFCSPLGRCVETLNNILEEYPFEGEIFMSNLIEERDFGEFTGTDKTMVDWDEIDKDNKINREMGIESLESMRKRAELFLEDLKLENPDINVLVVSHNGPIKMMISKLTGQDHKEIKVENAEINEFDYNIDSEF